MKRLITLLSLCCLFAVSAFAQTVENNGIMYSLNSDTKEASVTSRYGNLYNPYSGDIVIPESVTFNGVSYCVTSIGNSAFYRCSGLKSITIPDGVTSIGNYAFGECSGLTSITIPESVTSIGSSAFEGCYRLTSITIPDGVTSIGNYAFHCCTRLTSVTIPDSATSIGKNAFEECRALTSITIPNGVTYIGEYTFHNCTSLTSVTIPNSVTCIRSYAFYNCVELSSISIPNRITEIEARAFLHCSGLISITIPESVTDIGDYAFGLCEKIEDVYCYAESVPAAGDNAFSVATRYFATLHVPESAIEDYKATYPWKQFGKIVAIGQENEEPDVKQDTIYVTVHDTIYISNPGEIAVPTIMIQGNMAIIMCSDQDAYVLYTTDGSEPEPGNALVYSMPFTLTESCTIKAVAVRKSVSASSEYVPTGVRRSEMVSSQYYISPTGVQSLNPSKGINVVVTEYEDGSTSVSKEYVK